MRYAADHKTQSKARILDAAAREVRGKGPDNVALGTIMSAAGLTHGAFYAHFPSKDALVAEAVATMFDTARATRGTLTQALGDETADMRQALRAFFSDYLSPRHRDTPERGCPLPALAADMGRSAGPARDSFADGARQITTRIEAALARIGVADAKAQANAVVAQIVGAVALARAFGPGKASDAVLSDNLDAVIRRLGL